MLALLGCREGGALPPSADTDPEVEAPGLGPETVVPAPSWSERFYAGYLAETLGSDFAGARASYEEVLAGAVETEPRTAARAALRLAELELLRGNRRRAQELVARAAVLGRDDIDILERADRAQAGLASLRTRGSEVRGPPADTVLDDATAATRAAFRAAEATLSAYHRRLLEPRLEGIRAGVRQKEHAMDQAVRAYRTVTESGEREAVVAAEFRIGSLHHDLALALMFDVPPELEEHEAAKLRRSLRGKATAHLRKARDAYERALEAAGSAEIPASTERWQLAAEVGQRGTRDLIAGRE
jgi:hypothetical protein